MFVRVRCWIVHILRKNKIKPTTNIIVNEWYRSYLRRLLQPSRGQTFGHLISLFVYLCCRFCTIEFIKYSLKHCCSILVKLLSPKISRIEIGKKHRHSLGTFAIQWHNIACWPMTSILDQIPERDIWPKTEWTWKNLAPQLHRTFAIEWRNFRCLHSDVWSQLQVRF